MVRARSSKKSTSSPGFFIRDIFQIVVGATILAIPVGFTQETWDLGSSLPWANIFALAVLSLVFIAAFIFYNYYVQHGLKGHRWQFLERIIYTYVVSFIVVSVILTIIQVAPLGTNLALAIKRIIIVTLPASMSAAVADMIR
ncbi:MAG: DUF2391 family protein [Candidatus Nanoarchaeia archaeon]